MEDIPNFLFCLLFRIIFPFKDFNTTLCDTNMGNLTACLKGKYLKLKQIQENDESDEDINDEIRKNYCCNFCSFNYIINIINYTSIIN